METSSHKNQLCLTAENRNCQSTTPGSHTRLPRTPGFSHRPTEGAPPPSLMTPPRPAARSSSRRQLVLAVTSQVPAARWGGAARRPQDGGPDPSAPGAAQRPAQSGLLQQRLRGAEAQQVRARAPWEYPHPEASRLLSLGRAPGPAVQPLAAGGDPS